MTADTDREARLEEIRKRVEAHERGVKGAAHDDEASDLRFLLSEIDRLREIEQIARDAMRVLESSGAAWVDPEGRLESETYRRLKGRLTEGGRVS